LPVQLNVPAGGWYAAESSALALLALISAVAFGVQVSGR